MKKKKAISIVAAALLLTIATVAMANGGLVFDSVETEEIFAPNFDSLASHMGYNTEEKFDTFHKTALFMGKYCTTKESFGYIEQMILEGCDPQTTMDIYQFYLTTNEDISIVRKIYDMVYTGEPITNRDVVFENAFNQITNNKCGVLTKEDVQNYLEKGLAVSDISQANLLSRKGVMTIQEILDALLNGKTWETIVETISGEAINFKYRNADGATLVDAMYVATMRNESINTVLAGDSDDYFMEKTKNVNEHLKGRGYWKGKKSSNFEQIKKAGAKKGISEEKLNSMMDEGYSELDLINTINNEECTPQNIDSIAKREAEKE